MNKLFKAFLGTLAFVVFLSPLFSAAPALSSWGRNLLARVNSGSSTHPLIEVDLNQNDQAPELEPFFEGAISVTFDDGWQSVYQNGFALLERFGVNTTQYLATDVLNAPDYMSWEQIEHMQRGNHEIGAHSHTHADLTTLDGAGLDFELEEPIRLLRERFGPIDHMASPYNSHNDQTRQAIMSRYASHRTTDWPYINTAAGFDETRILAFTVRQDTKLEELKQLITDTRDKKGWLVLVYHGIELSGSTFDVTPQTFEQHLQTMKDSGLDIVTVGDFLDTWQGAS